MSAAPLRLDAEAAADVPTLALAWAQALIEDAADAPARQRALETARAALRHTAPAPIDRLSALFGLSPFEEDLLLLAFAVAADASVAARLAARAELPGVAQVTPHTALALLVGRGAEARALAASRLSPTAPLRAFALLAPGEEPATAATLLLLDERLQRYVAGEDYLDPRLAGAVRPLHAGSPPPRARAAVGSTALALRSERRASILTGPRGSGRRAVAEAAAAQAGLTAYVLRTEALPADPHQLRAMLQLLAREAAIARMALVLEVPSGSAQDQRQAGAPLLELLVDAPPAPLVLVAEIRPACALDLPGAALAPLTSEDRAILWREALGGAVPQAEAAADRFGVGPAEIAAIAARIASPAELWGACRDLAAADLGELATRIVPSYCWDDLVLPPALLARLRALADALRYRAQVFDRGGFARKHARARGVAALFAGPSGTGKTMAAEVLANDLELDLYRVDLSQVVSKYIGETEKNLARVFDAAEAGGAVLLFDEADALFGRRSEVKDAHDRYANVEVSYLLQRMEQHGGLAILASNLKGNLDSAFLRRLRHVLDFPQPDAADRRRLWAGAFPPETTTEPLDLDALARLDVPGGNIVVIAINAAFLAAAEARPVSMRDIGRAAQAEFAKLDREFRCPW